MCPWSHFQKLPMIFSFLKEQNNNWTFTSNKVIIVCQAVSVFWVLKYILSHLFCFIGKKYFQLIVDKLKLFQFIMKQHFHVFMNRIFEQSWFREEHNRIWATKQNKRNGKEFYEWNSNQTWLTVNDQFHFDQLSAFGLSSIQMTW